MFVTKIVPSKPGRRYQILQISISFQPASTEKFKVHYTPNCMYNKNSIQKPKENLSTAYRYMNFPPNQSGSTHDLANSILRAFSVHMISQKWNN